MHTLRVLLRAAPLVCFAIACGPELDEPSSRNISGHWISSDRAGSLSGLSLDITQQPDGTLVGRWSGVFAIGAQCPPGLGSNPTGPLNGANTSLSVRFSMLGAGDFEGQAVDANTLRGGLISCGSSYAVAFSAAAPID
jgi:hypothetical protein